MRPFQRKRKTPAHAMSKAGRQTGIVERPNSGLGYFPHPVVGDGLFPAAEALSPVIFDLLFMLPIKVHFEVVESPI